MRSLLLYSILIIAFQTACNDATDHKHSDADTSRDSSGDPIEPSKDTRDVAGCYMRVMGRDTLVVRLTQTGDSVNGRIFFDNFEKDGSSGTAAGRVSNDTVHIYYDFQAEGTQSVMEMYFKAEENAILPGNGDIAVKGDTAYFTSVQSVKFAGDGKLTKLPCEELAPKFLK